MWAGGVGSSSGAVLATLSGTTITRELVKDSADVAHGNGLAIRSFPIGLALDSASRPGLVVHKEPPAAYNAELAYWRPGGATYTKITDSQNHQNDDGAARLAYDGLKPRVLNRLQQGPSGPRRRRALSRALGLHEGGRVVLERMFDVCSGSRTGEWRCARAPCRAQSHSTAQWSMSHASKTSEWITTCAFAHIASCTRSRGLHA